jgi:small conductance mechanosensitive channel
MEEVAEKISSSQFSLPALRDFGIKFLIALVVYFIGHRLIVFTRKLFVKAANKTNADVSVTHFFSSVMYVILHIILIFIIAGQMGFDTSTFIAILASSTITIGLALRDSLAHFAGGILILFTHPFKVGDYIICSAGEGTVKAIGIVYTTIVTLDNCSITIPNGTLASDNVKNCTAFPFRRVDLFVSIGYDEDIKKAKEVLYTVYHDHPNISKEHDINIFVSELGESTIVLGGQGYVENRDYLKTKWEITEDIKHAFDKAEITIPFSQLDLHVKPE